jgi:hypothetical protein
MALSEHRLSKFRFPLLSFAAHKQRNGWLHRLPGIFQLREIEHSARVNLLKQLVSVNSTKFQEVWKKLKLALRRLNFGIKLPPPQDWSLIALQVAGCSVVIPVLIPRHLGRFRYFITSPPCLLLFFWKYHYAKQFNRFS